MSKEAKIPTIIGFFLLVIGLAVGVLLVQRQQVFRLAASPELTPKEVRVTNITDTSFSVSWLTDKQTSGFVAFGTSPSLGQTGSDDQDTGTTPTPRLVHHVTITGLIPRTRYLFKIGAGDSTFDNNGKPWEQTTGPALPPRAADVISGTVQTSTGTPPLEQALVYVTLPTASPLSTVTDESGHFSLTLSAARTSDLSFFATYDGQTAFAMFVQAGNGQNSSAQVTVGNARPVPPLIMGQTHDFRTPTTPADYTSPRSTLEFPIPTPTATPSSSSGQTGGFPLETLSTPLPTTHELTIENPEQGEKIATGKPEFRGTGTPGAKLTVTVESSLLTATVTVGPDGTWEWTPPNPLPAGEHTVTITTSGQQPQAVAHRFTVLAASNALPAFTSTPSGETATSTPSPTASPSATPKVTGAARISLPSTQSGVPVAGDLTITFSLFILGIVSVFGGIVLFRTNSKQA